nr:WYL domain-containing protein [Lachnospiraceae bacterium]
KLDFRELKRQGYNIGKEKRCSEEKNISKTEGSLKKLLTLPLPSSNKTAVRAIQLLCELTEEYGSIAEIADGNRDDYFASRSTVFRTLLPYLKELNLIRKDDKHWVPSTIYLSSLPKNYSEILNFAAYCLSKNKREGEEIYKQAIGYLDRKSMIIRPKKDNMLWNLVFYIQTLKKYGADRNPVSFKYKGQLIHFFYLGFVAYSSDKDVVYLIGSTKPSKIEKYRVLKADEIEWDTMGKVFDKNFEDMLRDRKKNVRNRTKCFYKKLRVEMFDAVEDRLQPVRIRIKYSMETDYEINKLYKSRREQWKIFDNEMAAVRVSEEDKSHGIPGMRYINAQGEKKDRYELTDPAEYIEYSDNIRGIANFANYLRRFGDAVEVIENEKLKGIMADGAIRALEHYEG